MTSGRHWAQAALFSGCVFITGCGASDDASPSSDQRELALEAVEVESVVLRETPRTRRVRVRGRLESAFDLSLSAEREGRVVSVPRAEGDFVASAELLLALDSRRARLEFERAKIRFEEAKRDARTRAAEVRALELEVELAKETVDRCRVIAPRDGRIESIHPEVGEWVQRGQVVVRLVDTSNLQAVFEVDESLRREIRVGDSVELRDPSSSLQPLIASIGMLAAASDQGNGRFRVEIPFAREERNWRAGMLLQGVFRLGSDDREILVPKRALSRRFEQWRAFVVAAAESGAVITREVGLSAEEVIGQPEFLRIRSGLSAGDRLILGPRLGLRDGIPVSAPKSSQDSR